MSIWYKIRCMVDYNFDDSIFHFQSTFWYLILLSIREEIRTWELERRCWTWKELEERKFCLFVWLCVCWPWLNGVIKPCCLLNDDILASFMLSRSITSLLTEFVYLLSHPVMMHLLSFQFPLEKLLRSYRWTIDRYRSTGVEHFFDCYTLHAMWFLLCTVIWIL